MRNPPDFVMYVVMVKKTGEARYNPLWCGGIQAQGFARRKDAMPLLRMQQDIYGKKNAYVQQYGPYS